MSELRRLAWRLSQTLPDFLSARIESLLLGRNKIGIQFQDEDQAVVDYVSRVQPVVWKSINVHKPEFLERLRAASPGAFGIYRAHPDSDWVDNPEWLGGAHVRRIQDELGDDLRYFQAIEDNNEYVHAHQHDLHDLADRYMATFIESCVRQLGKSPIVLNAATGNFGDDITVFHRTLAALREHGGYIGFHEYDWPTMWRLHDKDIADGGEGMWLCLRWKRAARAIRAAYDGWCPQFIITEAGIDSGVYSGVPAQMGFRGVHPDDLNAAVDNYIQSLRWYYDNLDDDVFAVTLFGCGMVAPWDSPKGFDIKGTSVPDQIRLFPVQEPPEPEPPEPPPNGGDEMDIRVVDMQYNERDLAWAEAKYGVAFRRAEVAPGQKVYRLVELWEKTGHSSLITQVLGEDGSPMANIDVAFYWPSAPEDPSANPNDWYTKFVRGLTNENGDVGPGMGKGAYIGEGECGPHAVWVRDPNIPSDLCECLGMLAGTNHDHLDQKFKLMVGEGNGEPPDNGGETVLKFKERLEFDHPEAALGIAYPTDVSVDTRGAGVAPGVSHGEIHPEAWVYPGGAEMALVQYGANFEGGEPRLYKLLVYRMSDGQPITDEIEEMFAPIGQSPRQRVIHVFEKSDEPGPGPEPLPSGEIRVTIEIEIGERLAATLVQIFTEKGG